MLVSKSYSRNEIEFVEINVQLPDIEALQLQVELDSNSRGEPWKSRDACYLYRQTHADTAKDFPHCRGLEYWLELL